MRAWATEPSQRRVPTWFGNSTCPDWTTSFFESMKGCRMDMAPLKKNPALLSSGEPAKSSRLNGPAAFSRSRVSTMEPACRTPTLKLSKVV